MSDKPQFASETYVAVLSQSNADLVRQNGDYTCHLAQPITLRDGDQLSIKNSFIDSQKSDSGSIVLAEDTPVSIQFSYYDVNAPITDNAGTVVDYRKQLDRTADFQNDFSLYACYDEKEIRQLTHVQYRCPTYFPGSSGRIPVPPTNVSVFPLFSWTDPSGFHRQNTGDILTDPYQYSGPATGAPKNGIATCTVGTTPIQYREGSLAFIGVKALQGIFPDTPTNDVVYIQNTLAYTVIAASSRNLMVNTQGITIKAGRYDRDTIAIAMTKAFAEVGLDPLAKKGTDDILIPDTTLVFRVDDARYDDSIFHAIPESKGTDITFDNSNSYLYDTVLAPNNPVRPAIEVGARKFAIEYGQAGDVFQLSAAHQSVYNHASAGKENVAFYATGTAGKDLKIYQTVTSTGIIIHEMQPKEFWQDTMALYDNLVVPLETDSNGLQYYIQKDIIGKYPTESATITLATTDNARFIQEPTPGNPIFIDTTTNPTNAVVGDTPRINATGGYYLVEINGLNIAQSNYVDRNQNRPNISAIVSRQYDNNDQVTGFADSAIPYVHRGTPIQITSANVRILDPRTMDVVSTLGTDNDIFLIVESSFPINR